MKVRTGFVSNSSSSSFIIAVKANATEEDIRNALNDDLGELEEYFNNYGTWMSASSSEEFLGECVSEIMGYKQKGLALDSWKVFAKEFSDEDGASFEAFMYGELGSIHKDYLIIKGVS